MSRCDDKELEDYVVEVHNDLVSRGMASRPNGSMIGTEYLKRIHVRVSRRFPRTESEIAMVISDMYYAGRMLLGTNRKNALYSEEEQAMKMYADKVYKELRDCGKVECTPDTIANTEDLYRVYVRVFQRYPCTENEVARALMTVRKASRRDARKSNQGGATEVAGLIVNAAG